MGNVKYLYDTATRDELFRAMNQFDNPSKHIKLSQNLQQFQDCKGYEEKG
uniref:Uncharacterized protein n=1 Tax=Megaselia scalaris TaxID=36166 RepID=T1GV58_MEGSC